jgi:hypothetical protein
MARLIKEPNQDLIVDDIADELDQAKLDVISGYYQNVSSLALSHNPSSNLGYSG